MSTTTQQLLSLIQLLSHQLNSSTAVSEKEKIDWLDSALRGKRNLIQHLCKMTVTSEDRQEIKLALFLLCLIVVLADQIKSEKSIRTCVINDLSSIEGFWAKTHSIASSGDSEISSATTQCYAVSLMLNAHRLHKKEIPGRDWPARLFSQSVIEAVVSLASHSQSSLASTNARILGLCFDYIAAAWQAKPERLTACLGANAKNIQVMLEVTVQVLVAGNRTNEMVGSDPLTEPMSQSEIRKFANVLIDMGGSHIPTQLALLVLD